MSTTAVRFASPWVVQVNEAKVSATTQGADWWFMFRRRFDAAGRIADWNLSPVGGYAAVACDDEDGARWLAGHMIGHGGLPNAAVTVRQLRRCTTCREYVVATCRADACRTADGDHEAAFKRGEDE